MDNKITPSKILANKTVYQSKYFHIDQVSLEIKGKIIPKDIIVRNPSVFIIALTPDDQIYLVTQYRDALRSISLEVIAGTAGESEDTLLAAKRELEEEAGLKAAKWQKLASLNFSANMTSYVHIFLAEDLEQGIAKPDPDENLTITKMPLKEAVNKIMTGEITNSPSISAILMLDKIKNQNYS